MPLACTHCGTINPDGNAFCQSCGTSLAGVTTPPAGQPLAVAPVAAQPFAAPPSAIPPNYYAAPGQTPFYAPPPAVPGTTGPVHRLSRNALFAIIAAAVLVVAGIGGIVALAGKGPKAPIYTPPPIATTAPVSPTQGGQPTPQPTQPPRPTQPPTPTQPAGPLTNDGFVAFPAISGFTAQSPQGDNVEIDANDHTGQIFLQIATVTGASTNQQLADGLLQGDQKSAPDAVRCGADQAGPTLSGANGAQIPTVLVLICETYTPQNGQAFKAVDGYFAGLAKDATGAASAILVNIFATQKDFQNFTKEIPKGWVSQVQFNATAP